MFFRIIKLEKDIKKTVHFLFPNGDDVDMNEDYENVKSYLLRSIYNISVFNCKKLDIQSSEFNNKLDELVGYIVNKWEDE